MKKKVLVYVTVILTLAMSGCAGIQDRKIAIIKKDLNRDGITEVIEIQEIRKMAPPVMRIRVNSGGEYTNQLYPGWKAKVEDIDNDQKREIIIALSKKDYRDNEVKNRLYVYNWDHKMIDKWRGSRFPRDFIDFDVVYDKGFNKLRLLEIDDDNKIYISYYRWLHFGFVLEKSININCPISIPPVNKSSWYHIGALSICAS